MAGRPAPAEALADRFRSTGAHVIVTLSPHAAISLIRDTKVDLVFVTYMLQDPLLMTTLKSMGVPYIICATPASMEDFAVGLGECNQTQPIVSADFRTTGQLGR